MKRRKLVAGNWKLHLGPTAAVALADELRAALSEEEAVDLAVFPTTLSVPAVLTALAGTPIRVGIQWAHAEPKGAFTGTNSATIAREIGCTWLLAGHSEVRRDLGETDARVGASVRAGVAAGLLPMLCVGETLEERDAGQLEAVLHRQLAAGLQGVDGAHVAGGAIAYEPVWAIGTGRTATPTQAQEAHAIVRDWLREHYPAFVADDTRILYGGSVKASNAAELMALPDVDGCLVGGAALVAAEFVGIVAGARG